MADGSDIDNALIAKLGSDAQLLALMPNGVYWGQAPPQSTRFVIVSLIDEADEQQFGGRSHEDAVYLVKAVSLSTANGDMKGAAARIDALLDGGDLVVPRYTLMAMYREVRVRPPVEVDDVDPTIRWYHRGGHYRVMMAPDPIGPAQLGTAPIMLLSSTAALAIQSRFSATIGIEVQSTARLGVLLNATSSLGIGTVGSLTRTAVARVSAGLAVGTNAHTAQIADFHSASTIPWQITPPLFATGYMGRVLADGAIAYWRLGETSGTTAVDLVGGQNGTI